ncbi:MAG: type II toxin-antitoxin system PemK/MazF family toxin [Deltaproteobacteria bacterium]|nr:type II toxin-antitoxin system PemK/MazF family toxin [Deltaproteobacteria bacterium]
MINCRPADIVLVPFPFADLSTTKRRPALVLTTVSSEKLPPLSVIAMITSQIESEKIQGDFILKNWHEAGLIHPSKVRLAKIVSVEGGIILEKLGTLQKQDWKGVKKEFLALFDF